MKRIWHPFYLWEEVGAGMWETAYGEDAKRLLSEAVTFTRNAALYGSFMIRVVAEWRYSCEHHLTDENINRKAWVGHAATALAIGCPEYLTRSAWGQLSQKQQDDANAQAQNAIDTWVKNHAAQNKAIHQDVGRQGVLQWHTGRSAAPA